MNLSRLRAAFTKNRVAIGALGAAAVGALAWRARSEKSTATAQTTSDAQAAPAGSSALPSYYTGGAYDSTASDIYNAIQPQLEELRDLWGQIPVPGTPTTPTTSPYANGYYQAPGDSAIFKYDDGNLDFLTFGEYQALGAPAYAQVSKDDPFWSQAKLLDAGKTLPWVTK